MENNIKTVQELYEGKKELQLYLRQLIKQFLNDNPNVILDIECKVKECFLMDVNPIRMNDEINISVNVSLRK